MKLLFACLILMLVSVVCIAEGNQVGDDSVSYESKLLPILESFKFTVAYEDTTGKELAFAIESERLKILKQLDDVAPPTGFENFHFSLRNWVDHSYLMSKYHRLYLETGESKYKILREEELEKRDYWGQKTREIIDPIPDDQV